MAGHVAMAGLDRLRAFLTEHSAGFELQEHPVAYTAQEIAAIEHVPGTMMAKVVMAFAGDDLVMLVLPASARVDLSLLSTALGESETRLAHEEEFAQRFPDCSPGAMPPLGNLYGIPVYLDVSLAAQRWIQFQAGTHRHTMRTSMKDFLRLVRPVEIAFARAPG